MGKRKNQTTAELKQVYQHLMPLSKRHAMHTLFHDAWAMASLETVLQFDPNIREERQELLDGIRRKYTMDEYLALCTALEELTNLCIAAHTNGQLVDYLGPMFHELGLHNHYKGQFFSPQPIAALMASVTSVSLPTIIEKKGFVTVNEPACGSGVMVIEFANSVIREGYSPKKHLFVVANDIDPVCVYMTYVQLSLYGIPALVTHGDAMKDQPYSAWYTPRYVADRWFERDIFGDSKASDREFSAAITPQPGEDQPASSIKVVDLKQSDREREQFTQDKPVNTPQAKVRKPVRGKEIPAEILAVLNESKVDGQILFLPNQLDRPIYEEVDKVIQKMGGKWNRKARGHKFSFGDPEELLSRVLLTGRVVDPRKEYQFFPTPREVAEKVCDLADIRGDSYVLEPSVGSGALADVIWERKPAELLGLELNTDMAPLLKDKPYLWRVGVDFMEYRDLEGWNRIVMNPPFARQQDLNHILKAYELLLPGGVLVSVLFDSVFWRNNSKSVQFREFLDEHSAEVVELGECAFLESGTMVGTSIIQLHK